MLHDFYTKLSAQEKMFLYVTLGVIVAAVFDFLFLQPVFSKLKTLDSSIVQTKDDIKRDVRYLAYREKILKEQEIYRVYNIDESKTEDQIFSAFLGAVENFAREVEVNPGKLNPGDVVHKKGYAQYFANMECSGKFENIIKLIHKIDTTPNLLKVVKINIIAKKSSADEVTVSMKISKLIIDAKTVADNLDLEASAKESAAALAGSSGISSGGLSGRSSVDNNSKDGKSGRTGENGAGGNGGGIDGSRENGGGSGGAGGNGGGSGGAGESGGERAGEPGGNGSEAGGSRANSGVGAGAGSGGVGGDSNAATKQEGSEKNAGVVIGGSSGGGSGSGDIPKAGAKSAPAGNAAGGAGAGGDGEDIDGQSGAAGNSDAVSSSKDPQKKSDNKQKPVKEEKPQDKKKKPTPLDKVATGERAEVKSLQTLWNDFWGIKPKPKEDKPLTEREKEELRRQQEEQDKPNLLDKLLNRKE